MNLYLRNTRKKGIQFQIRESNEGRIFIDFYVEKEFAYNMNGVFYYNHENKNYNDKDKDIFKTIHNMINYSKILDKSDYNFYFKMYLKTNFLFKYLFEEDIETIIKNRLDFKLNVNSDINTKIFLLFILDAIEKYANQKENVTLENLIYSIKTILSIPLIKIKYDLIENNKNDINDLIIKLYSHCKEIIQQGKKIYNSKDWFEELFNHEDDNMKKCLELLYKIIYDNELSFAFGFSNNKLGFQIKTYFPENNTINFIFLFIPIYYLIILLVKSFIYIY